MHPSRIASLAALRDRAAWLRRSRSLPALAGIAVIVALTPPAIAGPKFWDWPAVRPFGEVTLEGAGLDTLGGLTAGPAVAVTAIDGPEVAWRLAPGGGDTWYVGTGHGGEIRGVGWRAHAPRARLESAEVFSLAPLPGGDLLAGGGPDGRLCRLAAGGDVTEVGRIEGGYVWGIAVDEARQAAWLATGSPAAVYRYAWRDGSLERVAALPAQNAMDVLLDDANGRVLVSTQGPGLVYAVTLADGVPRLLGQVAQDEARRLLRGPGGSVHVLGLASGAEALLAAEPAGGAGAGAAADDASGPFAGVPAAPAAALYGLAGAAGREELVRTWAGDRDLMTATWSGRWGWLGAGTLDGDAVAAAMAASGTSSPSSRAYLWRLTPPWGAVPLTSWEGGDVLDLAARGEEIVMAQAHPAALLRARAGGASIATSPPLDGGPGVTWGRLRWEGVAGEGRPQWSVRGGRRELPDETWTPWSSAWTEADHALALEGCRYLQWRVELPSAAPGAAQWRVTGVSVSATQTNQPPAIEDFRLEELRGVKAGGLSAGESIVHEYRSGLRAEFTQQDAPREGWGPLERSDPGRGVRVLTWRASDPNGDRLDFRLECRAEGEPAWRPVTPPGQAAVRLSGTLGSWDTAALPDGRYHLRLVASDAPDNPATQALRSVRELGPVSVDNTPPQLEPVEVTARDGGAAVEVRLRARDAGGVLAGARLLVDDAAERLDPVDGICDSAAEVFVARVARDRALPRGGGGQPRVRLEVRDLAGNIAGVDVELP